MKENCIFCSIVKREIESYIIYEDDLVLAFLDNDPINNGHVLIIPQNHKFDMDDLSEKELHRISKVSNIIVRAIKSEFEADGYSIMHNGGEFNDIGHFHMHVFPRYKNDGFGWTDNKIVEESKDLITKKLKMSITKLKK